MAARHGHTFDELLEFLYSSPGEPTEYLMRQWLSHSTAIITSFCSKVPVWSRAGISGPGSFEFIELEPLRFVEAMGFGHGVGTLGGAVPSIRMTVRDSFLESD